MDMKFLFWRRSNKVSSKCDLCKAKDEVIEDFVLKLQSERDDTTHWHRDSRNKGLKIAELENSIRGTQPLIERLYKESYDDTNTIINLRLIVDSQELALIKLNKYINQLQNKP